jgi:hypothetical protein
MTFLLALLLPALSFADGIPECTANGRAIPVDNAQVLKWKRSTPNQYHDRAHVDGSVSRVFPDRNSHEHFEIQIGPNRDDVLEVVYNKAFGPMPEPTPGMRVEACGDYITSTAQAGPYPPSPSGALIHWVHRNPRNSGHEHGWLVMQGKLVGFDLPRRDR